jgi:GxxExxY protein
MHAKDPDYPAWETARDVVGSFFQVFNELGPGFLESVYHEAIAIALTDAGLPFRRQVPLEVRYRGRLIGSFRADLVVADELLVELKAARAINESHVAQTLNYLRATGLRVGLVLNFGPSPQFKRIVASRPRLRISAEHSRNPRKFD